MGLLSIFERRGESAPRSGSASAPVDAVTQARVRARRRLIGALVLVVVGVVGFPLLFETRPRPIPVDIPIEIVPKDGAAPLAMPPVRAITPAVGLAVPATDGPAASAPPMGGAAASAAPSSPLAEASGVATAPSSAAAPVAKVVKPAPAGAPPAPAEPTATTAQAEPAHAKPTPSKPVASAARFVVQVGAFADAGAARQTRLKAEGLGLKTYTQVASTPAGNRIRVRLGPFATRDEAERALSKARGGGLSAVVLTL